MAGDITPWMTEIFEKRYSRSFDVKSISDCYYAEMSDERTQ